LKPFSYLIVGPGSLGVGLGFRLSLLGFEVRFLGKNGPTEVDALVRDADCAPVPFSAPGANVANNVGAIFLTVKAYQLADALEQHQSQFPVGVPLISLGNGAVEEILVRHANRHRSNPVRLGISTLAVSRLGSNSFEIRGSSSRIHWGPLSPLLDPPQISETSLLEGDRSFFFWHEDPKPLYRKKWLFNSVINSLVATSNFRANGDLLADRLKLQQVFAEAYLLGTTHWGPWDEPAEMVYQELLELIERTQNNDNSMALDTRLGRLTETDYLAGLSEGYGGFPLLKSLHRQLKKHGSVGLKVQGSASGKEHVFAAGKTSI
jgi:ketopantoate reductase